MIDQQSVMYRCRKLLEPRIFIFQFLDLISEEEEKIGIGKYWYRKKYGYRHILVPKKSIGIGIKKNWYRKKVSVLALFKMFSTVNTVDTFDIPSRAH